MVRVRWHGIVVPPRVEGAYENYDCLVSSPTYAWYEIGIYLRVERGANLPPWVEFSATDRGGL
jgi:hypothetical protein